jgi:hypothetical protein
MAVLYPPRSSATVNRWRFAVGQRPSVSPQQIEREPSRGHLRSGDPTGYG